MSIPHTCPVCCGCGTVPIGFYQEVDRGSTATPMGRPTCRSCHGSGVLWGPAPFVCPSVFSVDPPLKPAKTTVRYGTSDDPEWWANSSLELYLMPSDIELKLQDLLGAGDWGEAVAAFFNWHAVLLQTDPELATSFMRRIERLADRFDKWLGLPPLDGD